MKRNLHFIVAFAGFVAFLPLAGAQVISSPSGQNETANRNSQPAGSSFAEQNSSINLLSPHSSHGKKKNKQLGNAFDGNIIGVGVGFLDDMGKIFSGTSSTGPSFGAFFEHSFSHNIGAGVMVNYQSASTSFTSSGLSWSPVNGELFNYTNSYTYQLAMPTFLLRGAFHFTAGEKIDPYVGINFGYCMVRTSQTFGTNDPNAPGDSNLAQAAPGTLSALEYGLFAGCRYFINDKFGVWAEFRYDQVTFYQWKLNVNINPATILNLGVLVKL